MVAQIKKNKWKITVDIGFDSNGKRKRVFETFTGTKSEARIREAEIRKAVKYGVYANPHNMTFKELSDKYFKEYVIPNLSLKTQGGYKQLSKVINDKIGSIYLKNINSLLLTELYNKLRISDTGKKITNNTLLHYYNLINSILNFGVMCQLIPTNPNKLIKRPKVTKKEASYYDKEDVIKLLNCLNNEPLKYQALIMLALDSGARRSELLGLEWNDINFEEHKIHINKSIHYVDKKVIEKETKNYTSNRIITVTDSTINILKKYKQEQDLEKARLGKKWVNSNKVFTKNNGEVMFPDTPSKILSKIIKKYNLKKITFHQLRHTSASLQIALGVHTKLISNRLGHSSASTTLNIYSHIFKSVEEESAKKLESIFNENTH